MRILGILLCLSLCHCSTLSTKQCEDGDWKTIGFVDGKLGRDSSYQKYHQKSCPLTDADQEAWEAARQKGLNEFCTHAGGYQHGLKGYSYPMTCQSRNEKDFKESFEKGRKAYLLKKRKGELAEAKLQRQQEIKDDQSVLNHATQVFNLLANRSPTEAIDNEQRQVNNELYKVEASVPAEATTSRTGAQQQYDVLIDSAGAMAGTVFGFGLGHAVQGRYQRDGWVWTVADAAAIGSIAFAFANSDCQSTNPAPGETVHQCRGELPFVAMFGFIGLRVWQSIKLWQHIGTSQYNDKYHVALTPNGLLIGGQF